ncbi:hypothetical protein ACFY41_01855 [Streptomyces syringium]|uniref:hypothetical protein n=1 Tax=Streptomyces syringium TaxID=76729 RepID=UPI0036AFAB59
MALEKVVGAGLELPAFSTFDAMTSKIRRAVNTAIRDGTHGRISPGGAGRHGTASGERDGDGVRLVNRLKRPAQGPSWSHFKRLTSRLEWVDSLGDPDVWMEARSVTSAPIVTPRLIDSARPGTPHGPGAAVTSASGRHRSSAPLTSRPAAQAMPTDLSPPLMPAPR